MDNSESTTYEIFEKNPVKYVKYQDAIAAALLDKHVGNFNPIIIMVVGAGRGPIVRAAINASQQENISVRIYAVEKNPSAIVSLMMEKDEVWPDFVTVVSCDMRMWNAPEKADIIVSELLGSFGDNELSPECLDGAQNFLKDNGICIPQCYSSFLRPIQSQKLYNELKSSREKDKPLCHNYEQLYVVHQLNVFHIAPIKKLFTFQHPNKAETIDNSRYEVLQFPVEIDCVLHGFAGYFEANLYKDITISINPETCTMGMCSWFPVYIPIMNPIQLKNGDTIEVHFWRIVNKKNVWYEWTITKPVPCMVHNSNGSCYTIGL